MRKLDFRPGEDSGSAAAVSHLTMDLVFRNGHWADNFCSGFLGRRSIARHPHEPGNHLARSHAAEEFHVKRRVKFCVTRDAFEEGDQYQSVSGGDVFVRDHSGEGCEPRELLNMPVSGSQCAIDDAFKERYACVWFRLRRGLL
jgi:hypothetical protein